MATTTKAGQRESIREAEGVDPRARDIRHALPTLGLREFWYPAIEARQVGKRPVGLKICGEQLVFFQGRGGQVSALHNVCPHRGGSLMHGDCHYPGTISCPYHGWTYDGDGNVLAVLPEGPDSQVPGKVRARAFPTRTLRGMVFVWMGLGEPAPVERDVPPEFFHEDGLVLFGKEVWPVNWRVAMENSMDAHPPYVHRNSAFFLMAPLRSARPDSVRLEIVGDRVAKVPWEGFRAATYRPGSAQTGERPLGTRIDNGASGRASPAYQMHFPGLDARWPQGRWRLSWARLFGWASKRRYRRPPIGDGELWDGWFQQRLPCVARMDYRTHMHTRVNVPIDEANSRQLFFHFAPANGWLAHLYERVHFNVFHRWAMYSNFSVQDFKAMAPQRYDTPEYLSNTDVQVLAFRRLLAKAAAAEVGGDGAS